MVTGSPGLGKTLSVTSVLREVRSRVLQFNANLTKTLKDVQQSIYADLLGRKASRSLTTQQIIRALLESDFS
jgi:Cdc6-like AAA superfamily ATPase